MMNDREIDALAKGMVPFVRECVAETVRDATAVPPEIAAEVAAAVRLLHESPPVAQRAMPAPPLPRVTRIERDDAGNFVPVYDEAQT